MATDSRDATEEFTRPVIKLILGIVGVYGLRFIFGILPGTGQEIPSTPITIASALSAVVTLVLVVFVANFGRDLSPRLERVLRGPTEVIADIADAARYLVYAGAVIIAFDGLRGALVPFFLPDPGAGAYSLIFFGLAAIPIALAINKGYKHFDTVVDIITEQVLSTTSATVDCPECGDSVRETRDFCSNCGTDVSNLTASAQQVNPTTCPECNHDVSQTDDFCGSCGHNLNDVGPATTGGGSKSGSVTGDAD
jgi:endogenous inhibitor of DNA gyrase (YacG/DUF329 family)